MTNRNKNLQFTFTLAIGVVFLLFPSRAVATNDENHIQEIMAGVNGNSNPVHRHQAGRGWQLMGPAGWRDSIEVDASVL